MQVASARGALEKAEQAISQRGALDAELQAARQRQADARAENPRLKVGDGPAKSPHRPAFPNGRGSLPAMRTVVGDTRPPPADR